MESAAGTAPAAPSISSTNEVVETRGDRLQAFMVWRLTVAPSILLFVRRSLYILPLRSVPSPAPRPCSTPVPTPHVLLVDANDDCRTIYATILRHGGYAVTAAAHADDALREARAAPCDLVVLAVSPRRSEALRVVRAFRGHPATANSPLLTLSSVPSQEEREQLRAEGLAGYLAKPCSPLELLAEVTRILAR